MKYENQENRAGVWFAYAVFVLVYVATFAACAFLAAQKPAEAAEIVYTNTDVQPMGADNQILREAVQQAGYVSIGFPAHKDEGKKAIEINKAEPSKVAAARGFADLERLAVERTRLLRDIADRQQAQIQSWIGNDQTGYRPLDQDGSVDKSRWRNAFADPQQYGSSRESDGQIVSTPYGPAVVKKHSTKTTYKIIKQQKPQKKQA